MIFYFDTAMRLGISGYGKMGRAVERIAVSRSHSIVVLPKEMTSDDLQGVDCVVEFTNAAVASHIVRGCIDAGVPVISGTTGWADELEVVKGYCDNRGGAMLWAPNFSVGMHMTFAMNKALARMMDRRREYDISIHEVHHTEKKDAPSGTAIALAEQIIGILQRKSGWKLTSDAATNAPEVLPIKAERIPDVKGDHRVVWTSPSDVISIRHEALSRDGFALGAVLAAEWLIGKAGVFTFDDVMRDILA